MHEQPKTPTDSEDPQVSGRNDPAIDGGLNDTPAPDSASNAPKDPQAVSDVKAKDPKAEDNEFSPDFKSEPEHKPETDADIDTQGG